MSNLLDLIRGQTALSVSRGGLHRVSTERHRLDRDGIAWLVHELGNLHRKLDLTRSQRHRSFNPFIAPEPDLLVARISRSHLAVLNKFPVLDNHLLIITERFEPQHAGLSLEDLDAARWCLDRLDGLVFFNSSPEAGASQEHKHLQLVPLPLGFGPGATPIEHFLEAVRPGGIERVKELRFTHALVHLGSRSSWRDVGELLHAYHLLHRSFSTRHHDQPFNLLLTRRWMMLVPRVRECFEGLSVNALGFVGSLLVRDRAQLGLVRRIGPQHVLATVTGEVGELDGGVTEVIPCNTGRDE